MYKRLLFALLLFGCKTTHTLNLPSYLREDGFYYRKFDGTNSDETQLMRFYTNDYMVELALSATEKKLTDDSHLLTCLLDTIIQKGKTQGPAVYNYKTRGDSVFLKKKNWDFDQFYYNLSFSCKLYNDSVIARITPVDYDTTDTEPSTRPKSYTATFKFK